MILKIVITFLFILIAAINDYRVSKVKNTHILISFIFGLGINFYLDGLNGILFSFKGMLIPFIILYILFLMNFLPAGDIKLFMGIGAIIGLDITLIIIINSFLIGGIFSLILLLKKYKVKDLKKIYEYFKSCFINRKIMKYNTKGSIRFPFAPIVLIGYLLFIIKNYYIL